jgi:DNA-binding LacI/PurR family transcriptional regulator
MTPATIRDVAKKANVGVGTVSRVLNNNPAVSEETRQRVLQAIEDLNYAPNPIAKQLSLGRTHAIGVTLPFLTYPSFVERLRGVQHALADSDYDLLLYSSEQPDQRDNHFDLLSRKTRTDGILIISIPLLDRHVKTFLKSGVPVVLIDIYHPALNRIFVDDRRGGFIATQHLIELGHKKIGFICDSLDTEMEFLSMRYRLEGYLKALKEAEIPARQEYQVQGPHGRQAAYDMAKELLALKDPPTAIFAASDTQAIGVLDAAIELELQVPGDLSVIGYDDIRDAQYMNLTTIAQPLFESGYEGARLLLSILEKPGNGVREITMPLELVQRGTTAPPP